MRETDLKRNMVVIEQMIEIINENIFPLLQKDEDGLLRFVDPLDEKEISAHYGSTHAAVAWIIYGNRTNNKELLDKGTQLLLSILDRWESCTALPSYHYDFNNFALCIVYDTLLRINPDIARKIKEIVIKTQDSNNPTVNWYPMKWFVNFKRHQWTGDSKYLQKCDYCKKVILDATYQDGFIDDRMPKGTSFNLQYNVATLAGLQYIRAHCVNFDISKELGALLNVVSPDGDINYQGRGTNQIFAWGLWIYLLMSSGNDEANRAIEYVSKHLLPMLENKNIMLNEWNGEDKYMWWDYHYCSVYTAHLLLWLVLAITDAEKAIVQPRIVPPNDSGVHVIRTENYMTVFFDGRKEYLSEKGPSVVLVWTMKHGIIVKGAFAPWQGMFGNRYSPVDSALRNYCGLLEIRKNKDYSKFRLVRKLLPGLHSAESETICPMFVPISIEQHGAELEIIWENNNSIPCIMNIPANTGAVIQCWADGKNIRLFNTMRIKNQYAWIDLWQSAITTGKKISIVIPC